MQEELKEIQKILSANSSPGAKTSHQKFVPGNENIYGAKMPFLNELATRYKNGGFDLAEALWKAGAFEEKILAVKILGKIAKKDPDRSLKMVQLFAHDIGNWAVCDTIGMQGLKPIRQTHANEIFALAGTFNRSDDFWQRRLSLVLVEWYTSIKQRHPEIRRLVHALQNDKEYYVKKAIVWINKNFDKEK